MTASLPSDFIIRSATNEDRRRIEQLIFGILEDFDLPPDPEGTDADLADIQNNYINRGGLFDLLETRGGILVGTTGLYPLQNQTCELRKMYLAKTHRGRGLGKYLLTRTVDRARELGFKEIILETSSKLQTAIQMYRRFGFQQTTMKHFTKRADEAYRLKL